MADIRWGDMEPATQAHLTLLSKMSGGITCGCTHKGNDYWWLCQYHSGMDDGAEAMAAEVERLRAELDNCKGGGAYRDEVGSLTSENERLRAAISDRMAKWKADHDAMEAEAAGWRYDFENERALLLRLRAAVQAVRDLPVTYASLSTPMSSGTLTITQPVVRKADIDAALGGERDE